MAQFKLMPIHACGQCIYGLCCEAFNTSERFDWSKGFAPNCPLDNADELPVWLIKEIKDLQSVTMPTLVYSDGFLDALYRILNLKKQEVRE